MKYDDLSCKKLGIALESEPPVIVVTSWNGLMTIVWIQTNKATNKVLSVHRIYDIEKSLLFRILVTNF